MIAIASSDSESSSDSSSSDDNDEDDLDRPTFSSSGKENGKENAGSSPAKKRARIEEDGESSDSDD